MFQQDVVVMKNANGRLGCATPIVRVHWEYCVQFGACQSRNDTDILKPVIMRVAKHRGRGPERL
ncbi:hypothetical protein QYF61_002042 [Mycteria americana]|uniref:Uncharacterized protein n=1 Tax=Mycteria americana TaxID=33587 RepID=A0AAN7NQD3_MYCAM|nr:hypothetical protein QYF61_002042 [Mycteria americana]